MTCFSPQCRAQHFLKDELIKQQNKEIELLKEMINIYKGLYTKTDETLTSLSKIFDIKP